VRQPSASIRPQERYKLSARPLGEGSYAKVFRAEHRVTGDLVALKKARLGREAHARIRREIEAQQQLAPHPNIMPILDYDPGYCWYTMPIAEGTLESLRSELDDEALTSIILNLADGLEVAHQQEMVHRDISPSNILALPGSRPGTRRWVAADWGMVSKTYGSRSPRLTRTGAIATRSLSRENMTKTVVPGPGTTPRTSTT
jgi:serine/threonine protein kinase